MKLFRITWDNGSEGILKGLTLCDALGKDYSELIHFITDWEVV